MNDADMPEVEYDLGASQLLIWPPSAFLSLQHQIDELIRGLQRVVDLNRVEGLGINNALDTMKYFWRAISATFEIHGDRWAVGNLLSPDDITALGERIRPATEKILDLAERREDVDIEALRDHLVALMRHVSNALEPLLLRLDDDVREHKEAYHRRGYPPPQITFDDSLLEITTELRARPMSELVDSAERRLKDLRIATGKASEERLAATTARMPTEEKHVFISYVREDRAKVDQLCQILERAQIPYWRDRKSLAPGDEWKVKIRDAIRSGSLVFLACFSERAVAKQRSYMNEELTLAVEEFGMRSPTQKWLIPVRLDECEVPPWDLGARRTLRDLNYADLFGDDHLDHAIALVQEIRQVMGEPKLDPATARAVVRQPTSERPMALRRARAIDVNFKGSYCKVAGYDTTNVHYEVVLTNKGRTPVYELTWWPPVVAVWAQGYPVEEDGLEVRPIEVIKWAPWPRFKDRDTLQEFVNKRDPMYLSPGESCTITGFLFDFSDTTPSRHPDYEAFVPVTFVDEEGIRVGQDCFGAVDGVPVLRQPAHVMRWALVDDDYPEVSPGGLGEIIGQVQSARQPR